MNIDREFIRNGITSAILIVGLACTGSLMAQTETRTGCLHRGDTPGSVLFEGDVGGTVMVVGNPALERYAARSARVRISGTVGQEQGRDVFRASNVEYLSDNCELQLEFSRDALDEAIGRARWGVQGGAGLDPESIYIGAHARVGPLIRNLWFRPSTELGFAEVTDVYTINLEFAYFLPLEARGQEFWTAYVGGGPGLNLYDRDFEGESDEFVDVHDIDSDIGLNILFGVSHTSGFFGELKAGSYGSPPLRILVGYTF